LASHDGLALVEATAGGEAATAVAVGMLSDPELCGDGELLSGTELLTDATLLGTDAAAGANGAELVTLSARRGAGVDEDDVPDNTPTMAAAAAVVITTEAKARRRKAPRGTAGLDMSSLCIAHLTNG